MTTAVSDLGHGILAIAGTDMVTCSSNQVKRITHATFYNAHSSAVTVTVYYLRIGETIASGGAFKVKKTVPPGKTWYGQGVLGQHMANSSTLHAVPSVTNVVHYNVSGDVITG